MTSRGAAVIGGWGRAQRRAVTPIIPLQSVPRRGGRDGAIHSSAVPGANVEEDEEQRVRKGAAEVTVEPTRRRERRPFIFGHVASKAVR